MVYRRGGVRVARLRRGSGALSLHGLLVIQLCGRAFGGLPVLHAVKRIGFHKVTWTAATSAIPAHGGMRARASDTRSFPAGCALRILPGPARQVGKSPAVMLKRYDKDIKQSFRKGQR